MKNAIIQPVPTLTDDLQAASLAWASEVGLKLDAKSRVRKLFEEATELCQALGLSEDDLLDEVVRVYQKPVGVVFQEVGGVGTCLLTLCASLGFSAGQAIACEIERVNTPEVIAKVKQREGIT